VAESGDLRAAAEKLNDAAAVKDFEMVFYLTDPPFSPMRTGANAFKITGGPR
jgi:hypothetical protein